MANARGWNVQQSFRGPSPSAPLSVRTAFWTRDLAEATALLAEAQSAEDPRMVRLAKRYIREASAELAAIA